MTYDELPDSDLSKFMHIYADDSHVAGLHLWYRRFLQPSGPDRV